MKNFQYFLALALGIEGLMRSNLNMAMICMVNRTAVMLNNEAGSLGSPINFSTPSYYFNESKKSILTTVRQKRDVGELDRCNGQALKASNGPSKYNGELVISKTEQSFIFTSFYAGGMVLVGDFRKLI